MWHSNTDAAGLLAEIARTVLHGIRVFLRVTFCAAALLLWLATREVWHLALLLLFGLPDQEPVRRPQPRRRRQTSGQHQKP